MHMIKLLQIALLAVSLAAAPLALAQSDELERTESAIRVLDEIMRAPDRAIPSRMMEEAHAIAVIPGVVKAGLVFGGRHGRGLVSVRSPDGTWSSPSFLTLTGGSVGFQAGVQATDVVLVFRTARGLDSLMHGKFTLGADAAVAAGPVGRTAEAKTDSQFRAEIYSYSRSRGLFAGVALDGSALSVDHRANELVYGAGTTPRMAFEGRVASVPSQIVDFRDRLEEITAQ
jgi:lipid-binding SYLF domain-containing protein